MFKPYYDSVVDTIQDLKLNAIENYVTHSSIKSSLKDFVEIQRDYTKSAVGASIDNLTTLGSYMTRKDFYLELQECWMKSLPQVKWGK